MIATADLVIKVRRLVNEADNDQSVSLITDDTLSLDASIMELLPQAVALVQKSARNGFVNVKVLQPQTCNFVVTPTKGYFYLPKDFISLVSMKLTNWKVSLKEFSSPDSCEALLLDCNVKSVTPSRPVCVIGYSSDGTRLVEVVPATASGKLEFFVYEAQFNPDEGLGKCDNHTADAVAYACAALLYNMFERYDASKMFMAHAMALCGGTEK